MVETLETRMGRVLYADRLVVTRQAFALWETIYTDIAAQTTSTTAFMTLLQDAIAHTMDTDETPDREFMLAVFDAGCAWYGHRYGEMERIKARYALGGDRDNGPQ